MTREVAHQKAFEKALYSIQPNFPPGKLPAAEAFASVYYNMSQGPGDERGPWNQGDGWEFVEAPAFRKFLSPEAGTREPTEDGGAERSTKTQARLKK